MQRSSANEVPLLAQGPVYSSQRIQVLLGAQTPAERAHAQVGHARRLSLLQDAEPLGLGPTVDAETALGADVLRIASGSPRVLINPSAQSRGYCLLVTVCSGRC